MTTFVIDTDNSISAFAAKADALQLAGDAWPVFSTQSQLAKIAETGGVKLLDIWNGFAGVVPFDDLKPVKKFENRNLAVARIWKAVQRLSPAPAKTMEAKGLSRVADALNAKAREAASVAPAAAPVAPKKAKASKGSTAKTDAPVSREGSKTDILVGLMKRKGGATLHELMDAAGWQKHSVRGFVAGTCSKKLGLVIKSSKNASGDRCYEVIS